MLHCSPPPHQKKPNEEYSILIAKFFDDLVDYEIELKLGSGKRKHRGGIVTTAQFATYD